MNQYLVILGTNIPEIRNVMNLTQEELANMMGVSRPTIVKLEQDPSKLSKALAYALFGSVTFEIKKKNKTDSKYRLFKIRQHREAWCIRYRCKRSNLDFKSRFRKNRYSWIECIDTRNRNAFSNRLKNRMGFFE